MASVSYIPPPPPPPIFLRPQKAKPPKEVGFECINKENYDKKEDIIIHRDLVGEEFFRKYLLLRYPTLDTSSMEELVPSSTAIESKIDDLFSSLNSDDGPLKVSSLDDILLSVQSTNSSHNTSGDPYSELFSSLKSMEDDYEPILVAENVSVEMETCNNDLSELSNNPTEDYDLDLYGDLGIAATGELDQESAESTENAVGSENDSDKEHSGLSTVAPQLHKSLTERFEEYVQNRADQHSCFNVAYPYQKVDAGIFSLYAKCSKGQSECSNVLQMGVQFTNK